MKAQKDGLASENLQLKDELSDLRRNYSLLRE
jgi:hypothetical protein